MIDLLQLELIGAFVALTGMVIAMIWLWYRAWRGWKDIT